MQNIKELSAIEKLDLTDDEQVFISEKMKIMEDSFGLLAEIDTEGITPLVTVLNVQNILREDISHKMVTRDELLSNAPEQYDGYFQVPKTIE